MRVFVTGATGFVGSAVVKELVAAGHTVLGMVRSATSAQKVKELGATPHMGDIYDLDTVKAGAAVCDAVIHTAFDHDFSKFKESCETDRKVIGALAAVLAGTQKPMVVTSAIGLYGNLGREITEDDRPHLSSALVARMATEEAANAATQQGVNTYILRLSPSTHGAGDYGFVPMVIGFDKQNGAAAYVGDGQNRWPAVHREDAAVLYRLVVEMQPELKVLHAVAEPGIPFKQIAQTIGEGLSLPPVSLTGDEVAAHFTWFAHFAGLDCPASAQKTQQATGWQPVKTALLADMQQHYF